jgi:CRISPR-associated protein Cst2
MALHIHGLVITEHGFASNNRSDGDGSNKTSLKKIIWNNQQLHTFVASEAIRFGVRTALSDKEECNRTFNEETMKNEWKTKDVYDPEAYPDDDAFGFMNAVGGKEDDPDPALEDSESEIKDFDSEDESVEPISAKNKQKKSKKEKGKTRTKGTCAKRRGVLELTPAVSLTPFFGDSNFYCASIGASIGAQNGDNPAPYENEIHGTHYQYGFTLTPEALKKPQRQKALLDSIFGIDKVAGNHSRYKYDFSPESIVLRITDDRAPRILFGFEIFENKISLKNIVRKIKTGDILGSEMIVGGKIVWNERVREDFKALGVSVHEGVRHAFDEAINRVDIRLNTKLEKA